MLASFVCSSSLDSLPSKTYNLALKFEVSLCFREKIMKNRKNLEILENALSR